MNRMRIGQLLLEIAEDQELDDHKIQECESLLAESRKDRLVGMAADELTEYRMTWEPVRNIFGKVEKAKLTAGDLEEYRDNLMIFGRAIASGITEFKSLSDLKKRFGSERRAKSNDGTA